ncbi:hypothetical protein C5F53_19960 [Rhodoferax sp. TS-BS-61-7]|nr:hypothetical protein C5F53_19960 [Rhodoferax sp. TS-BS-61-7]
MTAAIAGAFWAGHFIARHDAEKITQRAIQAISVQEAAASFMVTSGARAALQEGKLAQADMVLLNYAALKASMLIDCRKSAQCVSEAGALMPTENTLNEALAAARAPEGKRQ